MQMIAGQKAKARKGGLPGAQATCYGYVQDWRRVNGGKPVRVPIIDKSKAKVVKEMFRRYIRGQSLLGITRWLNDSGIAAPRGKQWYESTVRKLLSNETLLGRLVHGAIKKVKHPITRTMVNRKNDGEVIRVDGVFPAIIDQATFDKVQAILGRNESTRPQGGHPGNTLRAIGKCAVCGWHLAHQRNTRNGRWYYMCGTVKTKRVAASNPDCVGILYAEYVDEVVALFLKRVLSMPIQVARYNAAATDLTGLSATETLDIAIAEHEEMVKNLVSGVARVKASSALLRRLESTEGKLTELLRSRDEIATHTHTPTVDIQSVLDARAGIKDALRDGDTNQMRALLTAIVSEVRCDWSQRKSAVVNFNYLYEDHREPIQAKMTDREAREWSDVLVEMEKAGNFKRSTLDQALRDSGDREAPRSDYRVSIEVRGAPLTFVPKWSITNAERATEEVIRQIAEALK
jgi:isochorismate hydrolase